MKNLTKVIIAGLLSTSALAAFADGAVASSGQNSFALKIRGGYAAMSKSVTSSVSKGEAFTEAQKAATYVVAGTGSDRYAFSSTTKFKNGFGVELAANYFITNNFAIEGSVGYIRSKVGNTRPGVNEQKLVTTSAYVLEDKFLGTAIDGAATTNVIKNTKPSSSKHVGIVPLNAAMQYHFAPDQSFKPYVGVGYGLRMVSGSPKGTKIKNAHGIVLQAGADIAVSDSMNLNVDVKHSTAKHKITESYSYSDSETATAANGANSTKLSSATIVNTAASNAKTASSESKVNLGTTTIMAGVSFPF